MKLGIRSQLYGGFGILVLLAGSLGAYGPHQPGTIDERYETRASCEGMVRSVYSVDTLAARPEGDAERCRLAPRPERVAAMGRTRHAIEENDEGLMQVGLGRTITSVSEIRAAVAAAKVQQTAANGEIPRDAGEAARGKRDVSANVAQVPDASGVTGRAAARVLSAAAELATRTLRVEREPGVFLDRIQAA